MTTILFSTRDELFKVDIDKMICAIADDNYISMKFRNGQSITVAISLQKLDLLIANAYGNEKRTKFIRIGRKYIVNSTYIMHINIPKQTLVLSDLAQIKPISLPVGKDALKALKQALTESKQD